MTPTPPTTPPEQPKEPRHRIAIIQEKEYLDDIYKTRTVIGLLPYEKEECDRLVRFMPEQYTRSRPTASPPTQPARLACVFDLQAYSKGELFFEDIRACSGESCDYCGRFTSQHDTAIRQQERERALDIINRGKSALYEIMPDGHWTPVLQAKFDVLLWVEESLRQSEAQR